MKQEIIKACADMFGIHPRDLVGDARMGFLMPARFALYKAFHMRGWSYSRVGRAIGGRDHTTIMHGIARAEYMMEKDPRYAERVRQLAEMKPTAIDPALLPVPAKPEDDPFYV